MEGMQEKWVKSLGLGDTLEEEMATHPSILGWEIPWTEEPERLQSGGLRELDMTEFTCMVVLHLLF